MADSEQLVSLFERIRISPENGYLDQKQRPQTLMRGVVVCLQNLHVNLGVQQNIASILERLGEDEYIKDVFVEGDWKELDFSEMKRYPDASVRQEALNLLLEVGETPATLYAACMRPDLNLSLYGVDDEQLYMTNIRAGADLAKVKDRAASAIAELKRVVQCACDPLLSRDFLDFADIIRAHEEGRMAPADYARRLHWYGALNGITRTGRFDLQRKDMVAASRCEDLPGAAGTSVRRQTADGEMQHEILARLCRSELDRCYMGLAADADLINSAFQARLTPEKARRFLGLGVNEVRHRIMGRLAFIAGCVGTSKTYAPGEVAALQDRIEFLWDAWGIPRTFYLAAKGRSHLMAQRTAQEMTRRGVDRAVLVVGGFHAFYTCRDLVRKNSIGCISVFPNVKNPESPHYWRLISGRHTTEDELFLAAERRRSGNASAD